MTGKEEKNRIPTFKTLEEGAAFWDTHSSEEFADELTTVENVKFVRAYSKKALTVRFDACAGNGKAMATGLYEREQKQVVSECRFADALKHTLPG
ncbi:MAG: hypothetical protein ACYDER_01135 [Ktedonobacteraceae bacterium]